MSQTLSRIPAAASTRWTDRVALAFHGAVAARRRWVMQRELSTLDDRMLKDLGLSRAQAGFQTERPILGGLSGNLR